MQPRARSCVQDILGPAPPLAYTLRTSQGDERSWWQDEDRVSRRLIVNWVLYSVIKDHCELVQDVRVPPGHSMDLQPSKRGPPQQPRLAFGGVLSHTESVLTAPAWRTLG